MSVLLCKAPRQPPPSARSNASSGSTRTAQKLSSSQAHVSDNYHSKRDHFLDPYEAEIWNRTNTRTVFAKVLDTSPLPGAFSLIVRALLGQLDGRKCESCLDKISSDGAVLPIRVCGIICTSPRAAKILASVLDKTKSLADALLAQNTPCFVVGDSTAAPLRQAGIGALTRGNDCGSARNLVSRIIDYEASIPRANCTAEQISKSTYEGRPYLFLCGDSRRETIPTVLSEKSVPFEEVVVYSSRPLEPESIEWPTSATCAMPPLWIVFFSPSGVKAAVQASTRFQWKFAASRLAAIGVTTAHAMRKIGLSVDAVAAKPRPDALVDALIRANFTASDNGSILLKAYKKEEIGAVDGRMRPWELEQERVSAWSKIKGFLSKSEVENCCRLVSRPWLRRIEFDTVNATNTDSKTEQLA